jgi:hypothetical protein
MEEFVCICISCCSSTANYLEQIACYGLCQQFDNLETIRLSILKVSCIRRGLAITCCVAESPRHLDLSLSHHFDKKGVSCAPYPATYRRLPAPQPDIDPNAGTSVSTLQGDMKLEDLHFFYQMRPAQKVIDCTSALWHVLQADSSSSALWYQLAPSTARDPLSYPADVCVSGVSFNGLLVFKFRLNPLVLSSMEYDTSFLGALSLACYLSTGRYIAEASSACFIFVAPQPSTTLP